MNQDAPIKTAAYLEPRYKEWKDVLVEVMYNPAITQETVEDSARVLLQNFQPELYSAKRAWEKKQQAADLEQKKQEAKANAEAAAGEEVAPFSGKPFDRDAVQPYLAELSMHHGSAW